MSADPYRQAAPMPPTEIVYGGSSLVCVQNADLMFRCDECGAEWRLKDTFSLPRDSASFGWLQNAWALRHRHV